MGGLGGGRMKGGGGAAARLTRMGTAGPRDGGGGGGGMGSRHAGNPGGKPDTLVLSMDAKRKGMEGNRAEE